MFVLENVSLKNFSTMRLGGKARYLKEIHSKNELPEVLNWARKQKLPVVMVGSGSNILWTDKGYSGLVLVNKIKGFDKIHEDEENLYLTIGGGENWDYVVDRVVNLGYSGIEKLSLIPGTAGATPVQNIGAYGQEITDCLVSVETYDNKDKKWLTIPSVDCKFGYRSSRFNRDDKGRFFIVSLSIHLTKTQQLPPFYPSLQTYLDEKKIKNYTPKIIRDAVIDIRSSKLPDITKVANNGSFFKNPVITPEQFAQIHSDYPNLAYWQTDDNKVKLSAASLIDEAGFKDFHDPETGMATWPKQPLVFVNEHANSVKDLIKFKDKIAGKVKEIFGVELEQEPETINYD